MQNRTFNQSKVDNTDSHEANMEALLRSSAESVELREPPCDNWLAIKSSLPRPQVVNQATNHFWPKMLTMAASISFVLVGFLSWQNYKLQDQLETVLVANYMLEEQFSKSSVATNVSFSPELAELEEQLIFAKTTKEKLDILIKRKALFEKQLKREKEVDNEFSI